MASNKSDSFQTYRTFVDSQCNGTTTAGITFNPPPKALYVIQTSGGGSRALGFQYRNLDGEIIKIGAIDGAGQAQTILEIGDCRQILTILDRSTPGNPADPSDKVIGLY
jgi:hypothetical protein